MDGTAAHRLRLDGMLRDLGARERHASPPEPARLASGSGTDAPLDAAGSGTDAPLDAAGSRTDAPLDAAGSGTDDAAGSGTDAPLDAAGSGTDAPLDAAVRPEAITVGELVDKAAESGFGFLIAVLSLIAIPFFGLSTPFGLAIALVGTQLLAGKHRPWLPRRARARPLSMTMLDRVLGLVNRRLRWLAASTRERWQPAVTPRLVGLGVVLLGLGLALPLPIPGSNMIFLVPLMIYAIGLLEGDGLWITIAHVATLIDLALLFAFGATVLAVLERAWHWVF